jgi:hypothetical protein
LVPAGTACGGLIFNGDFELGNVGFTTQYTYTTDLSEPRTIVVGIDPHRYNPRRRRAITCRRRRCLPLTGRGRRCHDLSRLSVTPSRMVRYWLEWTDNDIRLAQIKCMISNVQAGIGSPGGDRRMTRVSQVNPTPIPATIRS